MSDMRTIRLTRRSKLLHIEAPGCIINIQTNLTDREGHAVVSVSILADGKRYADNSQWWIEGEADNRHQGCRIVQTDTPTPGPDAEPLAGLLDALRSYVTAEDAELPRAHFLRMVADRIKEDVPPLSDEPAADDASEVGPSYPVPIINDLDSFTWIELDARIKHLEKLRTPGPVDLGPADNANDQDSLFQELAALERLADKVHITPGFMQDYVFVMDVHWDDYRRDAGVPNLYSDPIDFDGVPYRLAQTA